MTGVPGIYYRLLKNDTNTRMLANPQLRTSEGIAAQAKFGEEVPVPVTTFAPIASRRHQPAADYVLQLPQHRRQHRHHAAHASRRRSIADAEDRVEQHLRHGNWRDRGPADLRVSADYVDHPAKDGQTNMLAGLIRDEERTVLAGVPGLIDLPLIGRLFARNRKEATQTDIILTLTPHIVRMLDLTEADLRPFRLGRGGTERRQRRRSELPRPGIQPPPRDNPDPTPANPNPAAAPAPAFPQPLATDVARRRRAGDTAQKTRVGGGSELTLQAFDLRAESRQPLHQRAVAALDGLERPDPALPFRRQRRGNQRHPRSDVAACRGAGPSASSRR